MKIEYLIYNLIVFSGPFVLSFDRKVNFVQYWRFAFPAIAIPLVPYIFWDALVTNRHWWFNENYTLDARFLNLPIGEWLFFIAVPYACLFIWEVLGAYFKNPQIPALSRLHTAMLVGIPAGIWFWVDGKEYTALVLIALGLVGFLERALQTGIFSQSRTWRFLAIVSGLTLVFNGYLTARPVVMYDPAFQLDFRIFTIPVEDFGYGISLVLFNVLLFEFFKQKAAAKSDTMVESVNQLAD